MIDKTFVLATDLDGTFLGGSNEERDAVYSWIKAHRHEIGLIFVTGRDPQFIETLCSDGRIPWPEYVVGDVGTTIAEVALQPQNGNGSAHRVRPIAELEADISEIWGDAGARVRDLLKDARGLKLQPTPFRYRVSYDFDPATYDGIAEKIIDDAGFDVLISDNRYFDVLPKGVSKGPSLRRLLTHLGVDDSAVLVAGDTLNDLSLFQTGLRGVAVANSEPGLIARIGDHQNTYRAAKNGAAGIAEAVRHFKFFAKPGIPA